MGFFIATAKILLVALFTVGFLGTILFSKSNGFFPLLDKIPLERRPLLPGMSIEMRTEWTGYKPIDDFCITLLAVFGPMANGSFPSISAITVHFLGQFIPIWMMMLVEGFRVGNAWRLFSFVTIFGLVAENVAAAATVPAWCLLHFVLSPTVASSMSAVTRQTSLLVHPTELGVIPWAVALGAGIPVLGVVFGDWQPETPMLYSAQFWLIVRQIHPLITAAFQLVISMATSAAAGPAYTSTSDRNKAVAKGLRRVYSVAKYVGIASHVGVVTLVVLSEHRSSMFSEAYQAWLDPVSIWRPIPFWGENVPTVKTAAQGIMMFLQWDEPVTSLSILVWAFALNRDALSSRPDGTSFLSTLLQTVLMTVLGGPATAAACLLQERDEILLEAHEAHEKKT